MRPKYRIITRPVIRDTGSRRYASVTYVVQERFFHLFYCDIERFRELDYAQSQVDALTEIWNARIGKNPK